MKQKILLLLFLLTITVGAMAQNTLNVYQKDGTLLRFAFSEKPITLFIDSDVVIKTSKQILSIPFSEVKEYTFEDVLISTGIDMQFSDSQKETVRVYSMDGRLIKTITSATDINTDGLPSGTYIIKSNNVTYKFQKK